VLLLAFTLLMAGTGFVTERPALAAILVFLFSLPYLGASVATKQAHFLYATMLLGAVSYFMACYALGAPAVWFPLLSVPLVVCLLGIGHRLEKVLDPSLAAFPLTVYRAMNITVAVFTGWALVRVFDLIGEPGMVRYVAGLAFLGYAALYVVHCIAGAPAIYTYVFCIFLVMGAGFAGTAGLSVSYCWIFLLVAAGLIVFVGTSFHRERTLRWSRHFFICFGATLMVSLVFSVFRWSFALFDLAVSSLLLWQAYRWLAAAVGDVRLATTNERLVPRFFFLGALLLAVPLVPLVFVRPLDTNVAVTALLFGWIFAWISWSRREERSGPRNFYLLPASLFLSSGLAGLASHLPASSPAVWSLVGSLALLIGLGALYRNLANRVDEVFRRGLAEAAVFPTFLAWYVPLSLGEQGVALAGAVAALGICFALGTLLKETFVLCAAGPAIAGIVVTVAMLFAAQTMPVWVVCIVGAVVAGVCFSRADRRNQQVTREAANVAWLILSIAAVASATALGTVPALYSVTAVGFISVVMIGLQRGLHGERDVFGIRYPGGNLLVILLALLATAVTLTLVAVGGLEPMKGGLCLVVLAAAYGIAWCLGRGAWSGHATVGLFALGTVLVIFGGFSGTDLRIAWGSTPVLVLFALAAAVQRRFPKLADSSVAAGHLTSITLACAALILTWSVAGPSLMVSIAPYIVLYGLMLRVRKAAGIRLGAVCWVSLAALFLLAALRNTAYREQVLWIALLGLLWLVLGYALQRTGRESWPMPLYISATVLALFSGAASLITPDVAGAGTWRVFLVGGLVFASLFLILRENIFAYLVTLSLSLMAYDWVRLTTSHYTQDLFVYLLIAVAVLGVFFLLPYMKKVAIQWLSLPLFSIFNWQGGVFVTACALAIAALVASAYAIRITMHPKFCVACHNMDEYYESWQHSSHADVACLECHYEPGVAGHVEGKMGAMVQLAKYITDTRWIEAHASSERQPHAIVSSESCTRAGCHDQMVSSEEVLLFHGKIRFRHDIHLRQQPRGKEVNCVSCHGQVVEGQHISVTDTTCLTCHFYGRGEKSVAVGDCRTCHLLPEGTVSSGQQALDHRDYLEGKEEVPCELCHSQVTQGDAAISAARCKACHLEQSGEIEDQTQFHLVHVYQGHFDCLQCHDPIKHGIHPTAQYLLASGNCRSCHGGERHTVQERMYAGTAVPELDAVPDFMYSAGVACDGCHTDVQFVQVGEMTFTSKASGTKQCADCHVEEFYGEMLTEWQEDTKQRFADLRAALGEMERAEGAEARALFESAESKLAHIEADGSYGAHNYMYTSNILDSVESDLDACRALLAKLPAQGQEESAK
jgi:nitrate/TMAO reductase-like tetraheme cytochrome c subunit